MKLKFKKLHEKAVLPSKAHKGDAGLDLTTIGFSQEFDRSGKLILVYRTGLSVEIPEGHVGLIFMRSSVAERSVVFCNCVSVIDSGYRGEILAKMKITTDALPTIYKEGEKIAQMIVIPYPEVEPEFVEKLSTGDRGDNGFGSTDTNNEQNLAEDADKQNTTKQS